MAVREQDDGPGKQDRRSGRQSGRSGSLKTRREIRKAVRMAKKPAGTAKNGAGKTRKALGHPNAGAGGRPAVFFDKRSPSGERYAGPSPWRVVFTSGRAQQGDVAQPQVRNRSLTQFWAGRVRTQRAVAAAPFSRYSSGASRWRRLSRLRRSFLGDFFIASSFSLLDRTDAARDLGGVAIHHLERIRAFRGRRRYGAGRGPRLHVVQEPEALAVQGELAGIPLLHRVLPGQTVQV